MQTSIDHHPPHLYGKQLATGTHDLEYGKTKNFLRCWLSKKQSYPVASYQKYYTHKRLW